VTFVICDELATQLPRVAPKISFHFVLYHKETFIYGFKRPWALELNYTFRHYAVD